MIKIGFIYFDFNHIIPHFIGSANELYRDPECKVDILVPDIEHDYLYRVLDIYELPHDIVKKLPTYLYKRIAYKIQGRKRPSTSYIFKKHRKLLMSYDILVFNVFNHMHLDRKGKRNPKFVFLMHGAGDSQHPFTQEYIPYITQFDLITTSGQKINDLFAKMGTFKHTKFEICGYQKWDFVHKMKKDKIRLFDNTNPVVMYNPHFKPQLSSFAALGLDILEFFYVHPEYNLVFAPHLNLFSETRKTALPRTLIPEKYFKASNIIVDFGSTNAVDMTYTLNADVYMGDVSSQVYEFWLDKPKPAIFLNAHNFDWKDDIHFRHWHLGKVIDNIDNLKQLLDTRDEWQQEFGDKQRKAVDYTFDIDPNKSSSKRVAEAIKNLALNK